MKPKLQPSMAEEMTTGAICSICNLPFTEEHGYPVACKACYDPGGDDLPRAIYHTVKGGV